MIVLNAKNSEYLKFIDNMIKTNEVEAARYPYKGLQQRVKLELAITRLKLEREMFLRKCLEISLRI